MALREITHYALDVAYAPEDVIKTLVDFSDRRPLNRRPLIWRETSHPEVYRLHSLTATGADVTEGVPVSWSREQYDWSGASPLAPTRTPFDVFVLTGGPDGHRAAA